MDLTFDIRLQGPVRDACRIHLGNIRQREGDGCITQRGKDKQREKYTPLCEESKEVLMQLLRLNFTEFRGRFTNVWEKCFGQGTSEFYVSISRDYEV